jgi:hypothetical protein
MGLADQAPTQFSDETEAAWAIFELEKTTPANNNPAIKIVNTDRLLFLLINFPP